TCIWEEASATCHTTMWQRRDAPEDPTVARPWEGLPACSSADARTVLSSRVERVRILGARASGPSPRHTTGTGQRSALPGRHAPFYDLFVRACLERVQAVRHPDGGDGKGRDDDHRCDRPGQVPARLS